MIPVVGLDVAKGESHVQAFLDKSKPFGKSFSVKHTSEKTAFILVNAICFYLIISGITNYYISLFATYLVTFFILVFFLFSIYKMYPNNTMAKYNISAVFLSFLAHLLHFTYNDIFVQFLRIDPVDTMDAFSLLLIIPTLIWTYGYFRKSSVANPVILKKKDLVSLWMVTFGIPIIGIIIFIVMQGLARLSYWHPIYGLTSDIFEYERTLILIELTGQFSEKSIFEVDWK